MIALIPLFAALVPALLVLAICYRQNRPHIYVRPHNEAIVMKVGNAWISHVERNGELLVIHIARPY